MTAGVPEDRRTRHGAVSIDGVSKVFGPVDVAVAALDNINLSVAPASSSACSVRPVREVHAAEPDSRLDYPTTGRDHAQHHAAGR